MGDLIFFEAFLMHWFTICGRESEIYDNEGSVRQRGNRCMKRKKATQFAGKAKTGGFLLRCQTMIRNRK